MSKHNRWSELYYLKRVGPFLPAQVSLTPWDQSWGYSEEDDAVRKATRKRPDLSGSKCGKHQEVT